MTTAPAVPIIDPLVAVDHCLDARIALDAVRSSTLAGTELHKATSKGLEGVDGALSILRAMQLAVKAA